jgi:hypothetical protein
MNIRNHIDPKPGPDRLFKWKLKFHVKNVNPDQEFTITVHSAYTFRGTFLSFERPKGVSPVSNDWEEESIHYSRDESEGII